MMPQPIALVLALAFVASVSGGNIYYRLLPKGARLCPPIPHRFPHPANMPTPASSAGYTLSCYDGFRLLSSDTPAYGGTCTACTPGSASMGGLACNPCAVGYNATDTAAKECKQCPAGTISVNAANPAGIQKTNGNTYYYGVTSGTTCAKCLAGYYQPTAGGQVCMPCAPGEGGGG